jgi:predicted sulfurtransferase
MMTNFRDLPKVLSESEQLQKIKKASEEGKKVLTVCTGGIRCEKASGYIIQKGFKNVYQLHGGMHKFMEKYPGEDFLGSLYVFDNRETTDFATEKGIERPVVGKCDVCQTTTEKYTNCANIECHLKMLCCEACLVDSVKEAKELIVELRAGDSATKEREAEALALEKILQVAKGFVFCSDECRERVGVKAGKVVA